MRIDALSNKWILIVFQQVELTKDELATVKNRNVAWVQKWLNAHAGTNLVVDGIFGVMSRSTFLLAFANKNAPAITETELLQIARGLGDNNTRRIRAVATVESNGGGWFNNGLPKILYEQHLFWRETTEPKEIKWYSNPNAGNYTLDSNNNDINDSWEKLSFAIGRDPLAAFKSISIGKFQVLGRWYRQCGYNHPIEMLWAARNSELAHYQMLRDYILNVANLQSAFLALNSNAESNRAFAKGYNGVAYADNQYHHKLANALT